MTNLSYALIDAKPRHFDFSNDDNWQLSLPLSAQERSSGMYQPAYDFISPLPESFKVPRDFRRRLVDTTIVAVDDVHYLTVSRLGADLAWALCESYVNLGFNPPVGYQLHDAKHRGSSPNDARVVVALGNSLEAMIAKCESAKLALVPF